MDKWYESLKDKTFRTEFLAITPDEAREIIAYWEKNFKERSSSDQETTELPLRIPTALKSLQDRISSAIVGMSAQQKGVFVKLTTRSPKDSHLAFWNARESYTRKKGTLGSNPSVNDKLILLAEVVIESLRVTTGEEAMKLLLSSTRVGEDLEYALEPGEEGFAERMCIVLREWVEIPLWAEFRGFVWDGKLTTIGQYNHPVMFTQLLLQKESIKSDLDAFFSSVNDRIPLDRYIIDFAWTSDQVYLVEVNPFDGEMVFPASTGLWSWEKDREQMKNGPLELRIRDCEQSLHVLKNVIDPQWRAVILSS